jgi:hypothetical protein
MKKIKIITFLSAMTLLALVSIADAAYKLYLRNGSVIEGVSSYEKVRGEIRFKLGIGEVGIPEKDVIRIEEYTPEEDETLKEEIPTRPEPKAPAPPAAGMEGPRRESSRDARLVSLQNRLVRVNRDLEDIEKKEKEVQDLKSELNQVNLRIEVQYKNGRERAQQKGLNSIQAQQQYLQFLTPEERQVVQTNFFKKHELETKIKEFEEDPDYKAMLEDKKRLLVEKKDLEDEITNLQNTITF